MGEPTNSGEGWGESTNGVANWIYGEEREEWQGDGKRESALANGGAGRGSWRTVQRPSVGVSIKHRLVNL